MYGRVLPRLLAGPLLALALAGCSLATGTDGATAVPSPSPAPGATAPATPSPSPSPSVPPVEEEELAIDWAGSFDRTLSNGWSVRDCQGDRLDACVSDGTVLLGDVELLHGYPLDEAQRDQDGAAVLTALAEDFLAHFREDRAAGCPAFTFVAEDVRDAVVGGRPAARAAFSLVAEDGTVVERVINHFTLQGDTYAIVNTDAYVAEGGCLGPSEYDASFVPDDLATVEQDLERLIAGSPLPAPPTP